MSQVKRESRADGPSLRETCDTHRTKGSDRPVVASSVDPEFANSHHIAGRKHVCKKPPSHVSIASWRLVPHLTVCEKIAARDT